MSGYGSRTATGFVVDESLWPDDAGLDEGDAGELDALLGRLAPRQIFEIGSGATTLLLAAYAGAVHAELLVMEPMPERRRRTIGLLERHRLGEFVNFDTCGVEPDIRTQPSIALPRSWTPDLTVIDGRTFDPAGIAAMLTGLAPLVRSGRPVLVSRGADPAVRSVLSDWCVAEQLFPLVSRRRYGLTMAQPFRQAVRPKEDAGDVVITILTGQRPEILEDSLLALCDQAPRILHDSYVIAYHNGNDRLTAEVLDRYQDVFDERLGGDAPTVGIGPAMTRIAGLAGATGLPYWLHLEDDWRADTWQAGWLKRSKELLELNPSLHQIRLRHIGDRIQRDNFVTGEMVTWHSQADIKYSDNANWTFNPSVVRTSEAVSLFPATGEADVCRNAIEAGYNGIAHILPGVFSHTGFASLRRRTICDP